MTIGCPSQDPEVQAVVILPRRCYDVRMRGRDRHRLGVGLVLVVVLAAVLGAQERPPTQTDPERDPLTITPVRGHGTVQTTGSQTTKTVGQTGPLPLDATLVVGKEGAVYDIEGTALKGGMRVKLQSARVRALPDEAGTGLRLELIQGDMHVDDRGQQLALTISSGSSTITLTGTRISLRRRKDRTQIHLEEGVATVRVGSSVVVLRAGESLVVEGDQVGAVGRVDATMDLWHWALGGQDRLIRSYDDLSCDAPQLLKRIGSESWELAIPDRRQVRLEWETILAHPGELHSFRLRLCSDRDAVPLRFLLFNRDATRRYTWGWETPALITPGRYRFTFNSDQTGFHAQDITVGSDAAAPTSAPTLPLFNFSPAPPVIGNPLTIRVSMNTPDTHVILTAQGPDGPVQTTYLPALENYGFANRDDLGDMTRELVAAETWHDYHITGRLPGGLPTVWPTRPSLSVTGPVTLQFTAARWFQVSSPSATVFLETFDSERKGDPRWRARAGRWKPDDLRMLEAFAPPGGTALNVASAAAPGDRYLWGGYLCPSETGDIGLAFGLRDEQNFHALWLCRSDPDTASAPGAWRARLTQTVAGQEQTLIEADTPPSLIADLHVRGRRVDVYLGQRRVLQWEDYLPAGAQVGLLTRGTGRAYFDNLFLRADPGD